MPVFICLHHRIGCFKQLIYFLQDWWWSMYPVTANSGWLYQVLVCHSSYYPWEIILVDIVTPHLYSTWMMGNFQHCALFFGICSKWRLLKNVHSFLELLRWLCHPFVGISLYWVVRVVVAVSQICCIDIKRRMWRLGYSNHCLWPGGYYF